jgi:hypothetical protein
MVYLHILPSPISWNKQLVYLQNLLKDLMESALYHRKKEDGLISPIRDHKGL